jgi:ketosteroid isomerase-like protein
MSQQNVEIVRRLYEGWARGDFSESDGFDPEVEFEMPDWPEAAKARGLDAMRRTWGATLGAWEEFRAEPEDFIEAGGDVVVVPTRVEARGKGSGADVRASTATVWTLEAGRVVKLALYWDGARALEVAGLEPRPGL